MSEFKNRINHFYCQIDRTIKFPDSCEGDLLKIALSEIKELEAQLVELKKLLTIGCEDMNDQFPNRTCGLADKYDDRIKELETQLVEANQRADKAAKDGWLKTAETQLARAKKAEAQLAELKKLLTIGCEDMNDQSPNRTCGLADKYDERIKELEKQLAKVRELLRTAKCSECGGVGKVPPQVKVAPDKWEYTPCDWCIQQQQALGKDGV